MDYFDGVVEKVDIKRTPGGGPLSGLTFAVKDMIDIEGRVSGFGNPDWKATHAPAVANAPALEKLLEAGAHLAATREAWSIHGAWFESVHPNMAPSIAQILEGCKFVTEGEYKMGVQLRDQLIDRIDEIVNRDSVICFPTTWALPPLKSASEEQLLENRNKNLCMTALSSFYGFPQISIPVTTGSLKTGLSLIGVRGSDRGLLELAKQLQVELQ